MNTRKRKAFIRELVNNVRNDILSKADQIPETWDGIELRVYIADKFANICIGKMDRKRANEYRNTIYCSNL